MGGALDRVFSKCWKVSSARSSTHCCILSRCKPSELMRVGQLPARPPEASRLSPSPAEPRGQVLRWVLCLSPKSSAWKIAPVFQDSDCLLPWSFNSQKFHHTQGSPGSLPFSPRGSFMRKAPGPGRGLGLGNIWKFLILEISYTNTICSLLCPSNHPKNWGPPGRMGNWVFLFHGGGPRRGVGGACGAARWTRALVPSLWSGRDLSSPCPQVPHLCLGALMEGLL